MNRVRAFVFVVVLCTVSLFAPKTHAQGNVDYFAVCGKCGWESPHVSTFTSAESMRTDHSGAQGHYGCSTVVTYDPGQSTRYIAVCGKCGWQSPRVSTFTSAESMRTDHEGGHSHYGCASVVTQ